MTDRVQLTSEVADALRTGLPILALESTLIAQGMPWPQNVETALAVEAEVRALGAVPATIAILDGRLKAGLARDEIERLGRGGPDGQALAEARVRGVAGKALTPFLLARINALMGGDSLRSNVELVLNNVRLGARIAVAYAALAA